MKLQIVNTVNTPLGSKYDFGIHAAGCADVAKAVKRYGVQVYEQEHADAQAAVAESEADLCAEFDREPGESSGFAYRIFPCCGRPTGDIYARVAAVAGVEYAEAKAACEALHEKGLAVQTYAAEQIVAEALIAVRLLPAKAVA